MLSPSSFSAPPFPFWGQDDLSVFWCPQVPEAMLSFIILASLRLGNFHSSKFTGGFLCQFRPGAIHGILVFSFRYGSFQF